MLFVIQSFCKLITNKISNNDYNFIFNHKILFVTLMIYLSNYIILSFCEVVTSDQKYSINNFCNFYNRADLKFLLHCSNLCDIKIKKHVGTEIFIEIE